jgi:Fe-S cluster assembly iron-binding protein IscA
VQTEAGFRLIIDRDLLARSGQIDVDYLTGPFRRGFQVKATSQAQGGCSPEGSGCSGCG